MTDESLVMAWAAFWLGCFALVAFFIHHIWTDKGDE